MAPKSLVLATALLVAMIAAIGLVPHGAAALGASPSTSVRISGVVPCSAGSSIDVTAVPVFPNAGLQLVCGGSKVVASATADGTGTFLINMGNVATDLLTVLLGNQCKVVVTTPLAACDASLAGVAGTLTAPLKLLGATTTGTGSGGGLDLGGIIGLIGSIVGGLIGGILNLVPQPFSLV